MVSVGSFQMAQVFISYSRKDLSFVSQLAMDLKNAGFDVWYDVSGLRGGSQWRSEIEKALKRSQFVLVVLSPDSIDSEWVDREFLFASNLRRRIIPLMYRFCELPLSYVNLNYIDVQGENYRQNFEKLLEALDVEAEKETLTLDLTPPARLTKQSIFLVGGGTITLGVLVSLYLILNQGAAGPTPTEIGSAASEPAALEITPLPSLAETEPGLKPTETLAPTESISPSATPLENEMTDDSGAKLIFIPAGEFTMGSEKGEEDEKPAHTVYLKAYYLDTFEVTNLSYSACVTAGRCAVPADATFYNNRQYAKHPVVNVDWDMAQIYCLWREARLPMEAEWEKAARGPDAFIYPWGNSVDASFANYAESIMDTSEVGSYEKGRSVYGVYDMAGNVWEWVADFYDENYYRTLPPNVRNPLGPSSASRYHVMRGGSWRDDADQIRSFNRRRLFYNVYGNNLGFRCAKDATP
jgi:formylglycine-generating enzyme required for sulfatase activity